MDHSPVFLDWRCNLLSGSKPNDGRTCRSGGQHHYLAVESVLTSGGHSGALDDDLVVRFSGRPRCINPLENDQPLGPSGDVGVEYGRCLWARVSGRSRGNAIDDRRHGGTGCSDDGFGNSA